MLSIVLIAVTRTLLVLLFLPFSALDKVLNFNQAVEQAAQMLPARPAATGLICAGLCVEIVMSVAVVTGIGDRLAALILALYCVLTALLWKQFWKQPDFRLRGPSHGREVFWDFLKNLAVAGGFLLLTFGTSPSGVRQFFATPFASTHPYASSVRSDGV